MCLPCPTDRKGLFSPISGKNDRDGDRPRTKEMEIALRNMIEYLQSSNLTYATIYRLDYPNESCILVYLHNRAWELQT